VRQLACPWLRQQGQASCNGIEIVIKGFMICKQRGVVESNDAMQDHCNFIVPIEIGKVVGSGWE
jgi:hypothetical protein